MATTVSNLIDAIVTRVGTVLPNHIRLPNAYRIEKNPETCLKQGWSISVLGGFNTEKLLSNKVTIQRNFEITLTRRIYALESDAISRTTADKDLNEDLILIIKDFEADPSLNGVAMWTKWVSDGGITFLTPELENYVVIKALFTSEYIESLT